MKINKILTISSIVVSLVSLTLISAYAQPQGSRPATVEVATVTSQKLGASINIPANVISKQYAWLSAETTGKILSIKARGSKVKKGDVVAVVDTTTLRAQKKEQQNLIQAQEAQITYLRSQVQRLDELRAQNIAAVSQQEETQANLNAAVSNKAAAQARLDQVDIAIKASSIRAQFSGTITEHNVQLGELVSSGREVVRVVDLNELELIALSSIDNIKYLDLNDTVSVTNGEKAIQATVRSMVPFGDLNEGIYEIRLDLDKDNSENTSLKPGLDMSVQVPQSKGETVLSVPRDAIVLRSDGSSVYKVNADNSTTRIKVQTGVGSNDQIAVSDANNELQEGDLVIIRGAERLFPGQPVSIKDNS